MMEFIQVLSVWAIPVILAVTLHEAAHGYAALKLGDDTALRRGRVTLNPVKHVDPFGTVVLPLLLLFTQKVIFSVATPFIIGYAKPVPVAFDRLGHPRRDMMLVAIAGPATNIVLALICAVLLTFFAGAEGGWAGWIDLNLYHGILINVVLAVFNMTPLLPLDGGRILSGLLPRPLAREYNKLEPYGFFILIFLLFLLPMIGEKLGFAINPLVSVLESVMVWVLQLIALIVE